MKASTIERIQKQEDKRRARAERRRRRLGQETSGGGCGDDCPLPDDDGLPPELLDRLYEPGVWESFERLRIEREARLLRLIKRSRKAS